MRKSNFKKGISPIRILPLGFLAVIILGTALLTIPAASHGRTTLFEALFTAVSASCVTGLVVVDTGTHFTLLGQGIILFLIQIGGLGFMTVASLLFSMIRRSISIKQRLTVAEGLGEDSIHGVIRLALNAIKLTFLVEFVGAALLSIRFIPRFGVAGGVWRAVFHSVSAFCNAGFDIMGNGISLMEYYNDPLVLFTVMGLITIGGLGFAVLTDMGRRSKTHRLRLHTKLVLSVSILLTFGGALLFFIFEYRNPATIGSMSMGDKLLSALFQSVTCRTAGFNTIDTHSLNDASKLLACILMFIGGAPAGTAGGIKVTTIALLFASVRSYMRGRDDVELFERRVPAYTVKRSLCIIMLGILCAFSALMVISVAEHDGASFIDNAFEVFSAMGTVGLTSGVTDIAGPVTRSALCALMYIGRVGLLTVALSFARESDSTMRYPEDNVMVG